MESLSTFGQWVSLRTSSSAAIHPSIAIHNNWRWRPSLLGTINLNLVRDPRKARGPLLIPLNFIEEYWANVSQTAREFVSECLTIDPASRPTCEQALKHRWLASESPHYVEGQDGRAVNLLPNIQRQFDARKTCALFFCFI